MSASRIEKIANAILYEGYMLYPYRPSALKNQQRWNFGVLAPRGGGEASELRAECLVQCLPPGILDVKVRFLQVVSRTVGKLAKPPKELHGSEEPAFERVDLLEVAGCLFQTWQETIEREVWTPGFLLDPVDTQTRKQHFGFPSRRWIEPIIAEPGGVAGVLVREQQTLEGRVEVTAQQFADELFRVNVQVSNLASSEADASRDGKLLRSLISAHIILHVDGGEFISLLDPPGELRENAAACQNIGVWPVLVGEVGERDTMLASPIILYDYPEIAKESLGDLCDATEIDEILSLRILTMTDEEKREMRDSDERARKILERTDNLTPEHWMKLHGAIRGMRP